MPDTMIICFISPKAYPVLNPKVESSFGGAETQLILLGESVARDPELTVHFMVADYGQPAVEVFDQLKTWKSFRYGDRLPNKAIRFVQTFNKINADVYIQRSLSAFSGLIAAYCHLRGRKFVYMVAHDAETDGSKPLYKKIYGKPLIWLLFSLANLIIVQNQEERDNLISRWKVPPGRLHILKKGVHLNPATGEVTTPKVFDGIWIGRCIEGKQPEIFLELCRKNDHRKFIMIAPPATGNQGYFQKTKVLASKLENLTFMGQVENSRINTYLLQSKVFCLTSKQEGDWPSTALEAANLRLPLLSYSLNYDGLIDEYAGGFFCAGRFDLFDEYFNKLISDAGLYKKTSMGAGKYVAKIHPISKIADRFLDILAS